MTLTSRSEEALKEEVLQADEARVRAMSASDWDAVEQILADDFTYTHAYGKTLNKADWLAEISATQQTYVRDKVDVRIYGNGTVALMTGDITRTRIAKDGTPNIFELVSQQTWVKNDDRWQIVAHIGVNPRLPD